MNKNEDKLYGILGSILFHLLVILLLAVATLRANTPEEIAIIEVDFGGGSPASSSQGSGNTQPKQETPPPAAPPVTQPTPPAPKPKNTTPQPKEPVIKQNNEPSINITEAKKKKEAEDRRKAEAAEKARIDEAERTRKADEAERARKAEAERTAINDRVAGSFGKSSNNGNGQSNTGNGNQGSNPFGNGQGSGTSGDGSGSWSLAGRGIVGDLPRPSFTTQEEGTIVLEITVDPQGNVIDAQIGRGTTIGSESLRNSARTAARRAKFNSISGSNNQRGTITYRYKVTG